MTIIQPLPKLLHPTQARHEWIDRSSKKASFILSRVVPETVKVSGPGARQGPIPAAQIGAANRKVARFKKVDVYRGVVKRRIFVIGEVTPAPIKKLFKAVQPGIAGLTQLLADAGHRAATNKAHQQASLQQWNQRLLGEVPMLGTEEFAATLLNSQARDGARMMTRRLLEARSLFAVQVGRQHRVPTFQIDLCSHQPFPQIAAILALHPAAADNRSAWGLLRWFDQPNALIDGLTPMQCFPARPDLAVQAAQLEFSGNDVVP